ncbi:hypothetical protein SAICODRAFT_28995 [Saitoella complicata NRRL Y-17804]|uniref:uncharacterized protein n=1 Tax=Saitoella complicata (strain BCRC 22490 / CBS 7301 / JCM 7358 / NBRC 10748 / NRRL Y-17804) TaxID=698492 RepID=UPI000866A30F|nr:uncharacterized protein SAICODRAFT_28995 [Saitoella complicata NRRL Y-17804]ODQ55359.1 hypothetical protein SAICODRAFT_28995 [Saitoella complicata NRRL Y-17804]
MGQITPGTYENLQTPTHTDHLLPPFLPSSLPLSTTPPTNLPTVSRNPSISCTVNPTFLPPTSFRTTPSPRARGFQKRRERGLPFAQEIPRIEVPQGW